MTQLEDAVSVINKSRPGWWARAYLWLVYRYFTKLFRNLAWDPHRIGAWLIFLVVRTAPPYMFGDLARGFRLAADALDEYRRENGPSPKPMSVVIAERSAKK